MTKLADAFDAAAEALAVVAHELRAEAAGAAPEAPQAPSFEDLPFDDYDAPAEAVAATPHGSAAVCPKHGKPYREGKYGPYCASKSDEPEWSRKGWCAITPKNVAEYLRQRAAA